MINIDGLKKLGYDSISLQVSTNRAALNYIDADIEKWLEEQAPSEKYVTNIFVEVYAVNEENDEKVWIGKFDGVYFEAQIVMEEIDFHDLCDSISTDLEHMAADIVDEYGTLKEEICEFDENLMYIDRIYIEEKYRGLGIAGSIINSLNEIMLYCVNMKADVLILLPAPQEMNEHGTLSEVSNEIIKKENKKKLLKFYEKLGFIKLKKSDYMLKRMNERLL